MAAAFRPERGSLVLPQSLTTPYCPLALNQVWGAKYGFQNQDFSLLIKKKKNQKTKTKQTNKPSLCTYFLLKSRKIECKAQRTFDLFIFPNLA